MSQTPDEHIDDTPVTEELESSFLSYAMSVIVSRALPDVRDGLKPVHRRLLHSMQDLNLYPTASYVKSARVIGDCFVAGTLVSTPDGLRPIEQIEVGEEVLDPRGKRIRVKTAFANPAGDVVDVSFSDGRTLTVTPGQLFRVLGDDLTTEWVAARDLAGRTVLAVGGDGPPRRYDTTPTDSPGEHFAHVTVASVTPHPTPKVTYDIEVDSDEHAFVADGFYVHNCLGRFHPHGDTSVYEAMVRMTQDFSMNVPLVDGHGNFGTHADPAAAMRYCLTGDTRVRLADGTSRSLTALVNLPADSEADADFDVLDKDGKTVHASKVFNSGVHPVKRITTAKGYTLAGSHNHPVLILRKNAVGAPELAWSLLGDVAPGTYAAIARNAWTDVVPTAREYQLGVLLGAWVSEGWASEDRAGFNNTDAHYFDEVLSAYDAVVGGQRYVSSRHTRTDRKEIYELDVQRSLGGMQDLLDSPVGELAGHRAATKFIPEAIWNGSAGLKRAFLMAAMEGDGGVTGAGAEGGAKSFVIQYTTYSPRLAREMQDLLAEFGVICALRSYRRASGSLEHRIIISGQRNIRAFAHRVGFMRTKQQILSEFLGHSPVRPHRLSGDFVPFVADFVRANITKHKTWFRSNNFDRIERWETDRLRITDRFANDLDVLAAILPAIDSGYFFDPIASVVDEEPAEVYSIRVDSADHSFLAGSFVNHNTECRMSNAAMAMTDEVDEDTVDMNGNYDGKFLEPSVLPSAFPNLLVNGSEGIAVGMATKLAPHNLVEVVAGCQHLLAHPDATLDDLIKHIPAPDMPTGGLLLDVGGAHDAYRTGKGTFRIRARTEIVGRDIVITELPYQVGPEAVIAAVKKLRDAGRFDEVSSAVDLSDRKHGLRLVITAKRTASGVPVNPEAVRRKLFKLTPLEISFAIHNLALVDGSPKTLNLLELVTHYVEHRLTVTRRRCEYRKTKAEARAHLLEGFLIALAAIDEVVAIIRGSRDVDIARTKLMKTFKLSEIQATSILEMPLRRLTGLEVKKIKDELAELRKKIAELTRYLSDAKALRGLVSDELGTTSAKFASPRRSTVVSLETAAEEDDAADLSVPDVPCRIQLSTTGKLGRFPVDGHKGARTKDDALAAGIEISVRGVVGAITDTGRLLHLHPMDVPVCEARNRGTVATEFVADLARDETIIAFTDASPDGPSLALVTAAGVVKKIAAKDFAKASGQPITGFKTDDDTLIAAVSLPADPDAGDLVLITASAQLLRFASSSVRAQGRSGAGVAGIKLGDGDRVIAAAWVPSEGTGTGAELVAATVSDAGGLKHTPVDAYPSKGRGTGGVRCQRMGRGETVLVGAAVGTVEDLMVVAASGALNKVPATSSRRDAMGERLDATNVVVRRP